MTQIVELKGTEKRLYQLVAPLVMNPVVLKQNYNYPFRTSENFIWFVAVEGKEIVGFIPLEHKKSEAIINNYYIKENNAEVLKALLDITVKDGKMSGGHMSGKNQSTVIYKYMNQLIEAVRKDA